MGGLTPTEWPQHAVRLDGKGRALALLTLPAGTARPAARQHARQALRQILAGLLGRSEDAVALRESRQGPVLEDSAHDLRISLSYAGKHCLIGLAEGQMIGVDIVRIEALPEINTLARLYLPSTSCQMVLAAPPADRDAAFALAWAQMEARSKCLGLPLAEISPQREAALDACALVDCRPHGDYRIALATTPLSSEHDVISNRKPHTPCHPR